MASYLSQPITLLYGCSLLAAIRVASRLYATVAALPIPPEVLNTNGVKDPCSTSRTRSSYLVAEFNAMRKWKWKHTYASAYETAAMRRRLTQVY